MPKVGIQIDGMMVLVGAAVAGGAYLYSRRGLLNKFNPASSENLVYQGISDIGIKGDHNGYSYDDHLFAAVDLVNPFNESDTYAEQVWGLAEPHELTRTVMD